MINFTRINFNTRIIFKMLNFAKNNQFLIKKNNPLNIKNILFLYS